MTLEDAFLFGWIAGSVMNYQRQENKRLGKGYDFEEGLRRLREMENIDRAAILGREVGKPGNDQTCEYCRGTGVISDSIALTKPCPMCSTKQSAHKGEEGRG